jgi:haloalkane dehalogenase
VPAVADAYRTPDERFAEMPDFPWEPRYAQVDGLRIARIDEGDGEPVVLFHGEPTWSFLWRKVMPPLLEAGRRCIAPDLAGFGRSDKPVDLRWYSYDRHVQVMAGLLESLELTGATLVVHDWGGSIGMRLATEHPDWFARMVLMDTGLFTGRQRMTDAWQTFRAFVERTEDLPISLLVRNACKKDPGDEVAAAYDAPFPEARAKAGARAFPLLIPLSPEDPGAAAGQRVLDALRGDERPVLSLWADADPILTLEVGRRFSEAIGAPEPEVIPEASHFLQEDQGELIGRRIAEWLATP